jgi:phosphoribosylformylglycinamidine (FGAM) synthase PurS component
LVIAHVTVHLKPGISDPEGQNTVKALQLLGFDGVTAVHVEKMCKRLLTNPVIHDFSIRIEDK